MSLRHAILVLLEKDPGSGYDLVQSFKSGIGHFWNATHQQVYQELKKLSDEKLVAFKVEEQEERPDRKVYRITREGLRALKAWHRDSVNPPRINNALLVKVYGTQAADLDAMLSQLDEHLELHHRRLQEYLQLERGYFAAGTKDRRQHRAPYLTLRLGIRYEQHWIEWLMETRTLLAEDRLPEQPTLDTPLLTSASATAQVKPAKRTRRTAARRE